MVFEIYLISLNENTSSPEVEQILRTLDRIRGKVNMVAENSIIASFDNAYVDTIRNKTGVKLVGGINFKGRKVKKVVKRES
ncbi:MAG: hypothetical protein M8349_01480 [ANME-2 cluster archaeon]|nr:hypothetical protein [ANME-2 cluster archaeon]